MWSVTVVCATVAGEPTGKFGMRVLASHRRYLFGIRCIDGELQSQFVRRFQIHRDAIAMIDLAHRHIGRSHALHQLIERRLRHLEGDVPRSTNFLQDRPVLLPRLIIGELEERQCSAVSHLVECVTVVDLAPDLGAEHPLAPGGDQWDPQDVLDEVTIDLLVLHRICVVMQPQWQLSQ